MGLVCERVLKRRSGDDVYASRRQALIESILERL